MRNYLVFLLVAGLVALALTQEEKCKKACPKIRRPISVRRIDGSCVTYNNNCLLSQEILCKGQEFKNCYKGEVCSEDDTKSIQCGSNY